MHSSSLAAQPPTGADRQTVDENSDGRNCQIVTSEEFLREPTRILETAEMGSQVCIRTANAQIVVGYARRLAQPEERWGARQKLWFRFRRVFRRRIRASDASWID